MVKGRGKEFTTISSTHISHVFNRRAKCCLVNQPVHALVQVCPITKTELPWQLLSPNAIMLPDITVHSKLRGEICGINLRDNRNPKREDSHMTTFHEGVQLLCHVILFYL